MKIDNFTYGSELWLDAPTFDELRRRREASREYVERWPVIYRLIVIVGLSALLWGAIIAAAFSVAA